MTIRKVTNLWIAGVHPPPEMAEVTIGANPLTDSGVPPTAPQTTAARKPSPQATPATTGEKQTTSTGTDTTDEHPRYAVTEEMDTIADAARSASVRSIRAFDAAQEADRNAREVTAITMQSVDEANQAVEQTNAFIAATNHAAEQALSAAREARDATHQASEFTRNGMIDLKEMEAAMEASDSSVQNNTSSHLFERTQMLKQQTSLLRKELNNL